VKKQAVQYTIRNVPPEVDRALRRKAAQKSVSLNQVILEELARAAEKPIKYGDFSKFVGKWTPDPEFDAAIAAQRQIDWDKWK
jgi:hypothetical protein